MTWNYTRAMMMLWIGDGDTYVFPNLAQTCFVKGQDGDIHLNYRGANVVTFHPDGTFTLNSGDKTETTLSRLRKFGPLDIFSKNERWILSSQEGEFEFFDGIRVDYWGKVEAETEDDDDRYATEMTVDNQIGKMYL